VLSNLIRTVTSGSTVRVVLTFQKAGPVTLLVPVFARAAHFVTYAPPQPLVTTTIAITRHHQHARPSASPSASPSPSATP
jgi:hypothetical protein